MNSFFFDTSALVKIYHREIGTEMVEDIYENTNNKLFISQLSKVEYISALCKKLRSNEISKEAFEFAHAKFNFDSINMFQVVPFYADILDEAERLIHKYG